MQRGLAAARATAIVRFMRILKTVWWLGLLACAVAARAEEKMADGVYAEFTTPRGKFVVELNYRQVPMTVASFVGLAEGSLAPRDGHPYYTGLKWYRVVPGFVIQSGDPDHEKNLGKDDPGTPYTYPDEFVPGLRHTTAGVLSMANAGPDTNSSEFFITLGDCTRLNYLHSVFGHVFTGLEVLQQIQPNDEFTIKILRVGEAGRAFKADKATFEALAAKAKKYTGPAEPGPTAFFDDADHLLPVEPPRARYFNYKLANFERTTGVKVVGRMFAHIPDPKADEVPGATMRALAATLGVAKDGVLVAYFADDKDWRVWIGDDLVPVFLGRPVADGDLKDGGALHNAKMKLIDDAIAKGDAVFATQQKNAPPDRPLHPYQQVKLQTDALLDALLFRFERARHP
jgi:cyclophilin family peptidyl-prolyl cis-trans isomerase